MLAAAVCAAGLHAHLLRCSVDQDGGVDLRLRPLRLADEEAYRAAQVELAADGFRFGFIQDGESFAEHVELLERQRRGHDLGGFVEGTWLIADVAGAVVGRASIRHRLNDGLAFHGGHIGFAVRPAFRRRGYATEILRQSLVIARSYGVDRVLLTCDDDNAGSAAVIEASAAYSNASCLTTRPTRGFRFAATGSTDSVSPAQPPSAM
jgi:predicted acetyltransferase